MWSAETAGGFRVRRGDTVVVTGVEWFGWPDGAQTPMGWLVLWVEADLRTVRVVQPTGVEDTVDVVAITGLWDEAEEAWERQVPDVVHERLYDLGYRNPAILVRFDKN